MKPSVKTVAILIAMAMINPACANANPSSQNGDGETLAAAHNEPTGLRCRLSLVNPVWMSSGVSQTVEFRPQERGSKKYTFAAWTVYYKGLSTPYYDIGRLDWPQNMRSAIERLEKAEGSEFTVVLTREAENMVTAGFFAGDPGPGFTIGHDANTPLGTDGYDLGSFPVPGKNLPKELEGASVTFYCEKTTK